MYKPCTATAGIVFLFLKVEWFSINAIAKLSGPTTKTGQMNQIFLCKMCIRAELTVYKQGSNLTFELNSQMASTCSGFTSHKLVSTSLGTSVQHKIKKMSKIL